MTLIFNNSGMVNFVDLDLLPTRFGTTDLNPEFDGSWMGELHQTQYLRTLFNHPRDLLGNSNVSKLHTLCAVSSFFLRQKKLKRTLTMKQFIKFIVATMLLASALNARAVILSLDPTFQTVQVGDKLSLDVLFDTEGKTTVGGAFSVNFDNNAFDFSSVNFDSSLPDDPFFRVFPTTPVNSSTFNLGFGNFSGIQGSGKAVSLVFEAKKVGNFDFILNDPLPGHDAFSEGASYVNAQVQVDNLTTPTPPGPVPLPAAAWLLLSGITSLGLITGRKRSA